MQRSPLESLIQEHARASESPHRATASENELKFVVIAFVLG